MNGYEFPPEELVRRGELVAQIDRLAPDVGPNPTDWPGLVCYRFDAPVPPHWDEVASLALCVVAQGRKRVQIEGQEYFYDPLHYLVMTRGLRLQAEILEASPSRPFLSLVLCIEPQVVAEILGQMRDQAPVLFRTRAPAPQPPAYVSPLDQDLMGALQRFLHALNAEGDRGVLAPLYLREIVYRLLRAEQHARLIESALRETGFDPVTSAIRFMKREIATTLTVADIAETVHMSESAFAHLFKAVTGVSPYQFLRRLRLEQARTMLVNDGSSVTEASTAVGYSSLSHFISEFRRHFGETPRTYSARLRGLKGIAVRDATDLGSATLRAAAE